MSLPGSVELSLAAQGQPSALTAFLPLVLIMGIFYVLLILPAQRRQKKVQEMLTNLKSGDHVVTNGGLYGTVVGLDKDTVQLRIADQVRVKVARSAIAGHQPDSSKES